MLILTSPVKREFHFYDFRAFISFGLRCFALNDALNIIMSFWRLYERLSTITGLFFFNFLGSSVKMATKKQPVMEWTDDHDILLLREMIASELFQFKEGSPDRQWESIQERLNKLDNSKFMIKEKRGVRPMESASGQV